MPLAGALADRYGCRYVIIAGALVYALGLIGTSIVNTPLWFYLTAGVLCGMGIAGTSFTLAIAAMVKWVGESSRSRVMGLGTAAASFGQVVFSPLTQGFISVAGWESALLYLALICLLMIPAVLYFPVNQGGEEDGQPQLEIGRTIINAVCYPSFLFLVSGFFICGFHVAFIALHYPAWIKDLQLSTTVAAWSLALIGFFNIIGSFSAGIYGQHYRKKNGLIFIYFMRAVLILWLLLSPREPWVLLVFAGCMGILWLSTVPLTSGLVLQMFGVRYLATLSGIVMVGHQAGSFCGAWLGGWVYRQTGDYVAMWWVALLLSLLACLLHLPIREARYP